MGGIELFGRENWKNDFVQNIWYCLLQHKRMHKVDAQVRQLMKLLMIFELEVEMRQ